MTTDKIVITKKQFDQFWDEVFGNEYYIDEWNIDEEDYENLPEDSLVIIDLLDWGWQGEWGTDPEPNQFLTRRDLESHSALPVLRRWLANQKMTQVSAWIPSEYVEEFDAFVNRIGGYK